MISFFKKIHLSIKKLKIKIWQKIYPICFSILVLISTEAGAQNLKVTKLGLVAELVYIHRQSSQMALLILNDSNLTAKVKLDFTDDYKRLKTMNDQLILQFISDYASQGKSKEFEAINELLSEKAIEELRESDLKGKASNYLAAILLCKKASDKLMEYQKYAKIANEVAEIMNDESMVFYKGQGLGNTDLIASKYKEAQGIKNINENEFSKLLWSLQLVPIAALTNN